LVVFTLDVCVCYYIQCFAAEARDALLDVRNKKTPLDMLLALKACIDRISDAITRNIKLRRLDFGAYL